MCLAVPGKIQRIKDDVATVDFDGVKAEVNLALIEKPEAGDWVLSHAGIAIAKIESQEAETILKTFRGEI